MSDITMRLELVAVPVSDVDRAKEFYVRTGFNPDHDHVVGEGLRFVQLTPPGSACSIAIGEELRKTEPSNESAATTSTPTETPLGTGSTGTEMTPGSVKGLQVVVEDIEAAHAALTERGVEVSDVQDFPWGRFVFFSDPDGNAWSVQQIPDRA